MIGWVYALNNVSLASSRALPMQPRLIAFLTLAFVLYAVAYGGAAGTALDSGAWAVALVACASALAPLWIARGVAGGERMVVGLAIAQAIGLAALLAARAHALGGELLGAVSLPVLSVLALRLALHVPDRPPRLARVHAPLPIGIAVASAGSLLGVLAALPPVRLGGRVLIAPHGWSHAPLLAAVVCLATATSLRLARRRFGSPVEALASNLWASAGSAGALAALTAAVALDLAGLRGAALGLVALAGALLLTGHALAIRPALAQRASPRLRALLGVLLAALTGGALVAPLAPRVATHPLLLCVPFVVAFVLVQRLLRGPLARILAPHGGKLLLAIGEVAREAPPALDLPELATRVLKPLRQAAERAEAAPLLVCFDPARIAQLDAAGIARVSERQLPTALAARLAAQGEPVVTAELEALLSRRPALDPLVRALGELDALCAVPLHARGELEGALVIARGARRTPLTLEELAALTGVAAALGPQLSGILALERARLRAQQGEQSVRELRLRAEEQAALLDELRAQVGVVKAALGQPLPARDPIQYSDAMRALAERLARVAPHDLPVLLWGETGLALAPVAQALHRASGRASEPLIIVDCAALAAEQALARLFGSGEPGRAQVGLLELVGGGTLLLSAVPALPDDAQAALAEVLAERRARPFGASASYEFRGRIVATARAPLAQLAARGALVPSLAAWLESTSYRVPPLRERPEDLESLLLLALDRAARVLGKPPSGVEAEVLKVLVTYEWPGNDAELMSVIERAVERAEGPRLTLADLPPLALAPRTTAGASFAEQEREILRRALRQAGGSRTHAATALGLRRTELVEQLARLELDDPTSAEN